MKKTPAEKAAAKMASMSAKGRMTATVSGRRIECFTRPVRTAPYRRTYWRVDNIRCSKFDTLAFLTELYTKE